MSSLWRRPELRWRSTVSCVIWASFGFMYYGVILLSSKIVGVSEECSFDYSVLFFAASRYGCLLSRDSHVLLLLRRRESPCINDLGGQKE